MPVHGVVVVHGVSQGRTRGGFLAEVAEGVADVLDERGGLVKREFRAARGEVGDDVETMPQGTLTARPRDSELAANSDFQHEYRFVEAFWDDAFPPPSRSYMALRVLRVAGAQVAQTWSALQDAANARRGGTERGATTLPIPLWVRLFFRIELAALLLLVAVGFVLAVPVTLLLLLLVVLSETPGIRLFGFWDKIVIPFVERLDPFLTQNLGDATTIVERGMWSANARRRVEGALEHLLEQDDVEDVAIVAYSGGAGLVFVALLEGSRIAEMLASTDKKLTFVSVGSGINRMHLIARDSKDRNDLARRIVTEPFDPRLSRRDHEADTDRPASERFFWLDVFARLDPVASGRVRDDIVEQTGIEQTQVKYRQVINFDTPHEDHGGYFRNGDLVIPRLIRSMSGGRYPWPAARPANVPEPEVDGEGGADRSEKWPYLGARRRLRRLAMLAFVRMVLVVLVAAYYIGLWLNDQWLRNVQRFLDFLDGPIVRLGERIPAIDWLWDGGDSGAAESTGQLLAVFGVIVLALAIDHFVRYLLFDRE